MAEHDEFDLKVPLEEYVVDTSVNPVHDNMLANTMEESCDADLDETTKGYDKAIHERAIQHVYRVDSFPRDKPLAVPI